MPSIVNGRGHIRMNECEKSFRVVEDAHVVQSTYKRCLQSLGMKRKDNTSHYITYNKRLWRCVWNKGGEITFCVSHKTVAVSIL